MARRNGKRSCASGSEVRESGFGGVAAPGVFGTRDAAGVASNAQPGVLEGAERWPQRLTHGSRPSVGLFDAVSSWWAWIWVRHEASVVPSERTSGISSLQQR